jgi:Methyltransferase FkbM domain
VLLHRQHDFFVDTMKKSSSRTSTASFWRMALVFLCGYTLGHYNGSFLATTSIIFSSKKTTASSSTVEVEVENPWMTMMADQRRHAAFRRLPASSSNSTSHIDRNNIDHNNSKSPQKSNRDKDYEEGWVWIQVFYGKPSEPDGLSAVVVSSSSDAKHKDNDPTSFQQQQRTASQSSPQSHPQWFSQAHQDEIVAALFHNKRGGYFVDLAANDATIISNTYALERHYGWQGICIEPNPLYWKNLSSFRSCDIVAAVVGRRRMDAVHFRFAGAEYGGIAAAGFDNNAKFQNSRGSMLQYTVTLYEVLQRANAPRDIDYLSLDVEGAESFILMPQDWNENENNSSSTSIIKNSAMTPATQPPAPSAVTVSVLDHYRFKVITGERLRGPIRKYLKFKGYEFVERLSHWGESLWIHHSAVHELDPDVIRRLFPKKCPQGQPQDHDNGDNSSSIFFCQQIDNHAVVP